MRKKELEGKVKNYNKKAKLSGKRERELKKMMQRARQMKRRELAGLGENMELYVEKVREQKGPVEGI